MRIILIASIAMALVGCAVDSTGTADIDDIEHVINVNHEKDLLDIIHVQPIYTYVGDNHYRAEKFRACPKVGKEKLFRELGLMPGDIFISVGGESAESPEAALILYKALRHGTNSLIVRRSNPEACKIEHESI